MDESQLSNMDENPQCSPLFFQISNKSPFYDVLEQISLLYGVFFVFFLFYVGPIFVVMNLFAIFILTRRALRTPYTIIFVLMALNQSLDILGQHFLLWKIFFNFDCRITQWLAFRIFETAVGNLCPMFSAHATWLAVIITFVRLRHLHSNTGEPSFCYIIALCSLSFVMVFLVGTPQFLANDITWVGIESYMGCDAEDWIPPIPVLHDSDRLTDNDCLLLRITYISSGVFYNALPCTLLIVFSAALTIRLSKIRKLHADAMMGRSSAVNAESVRSSRMIAMIVLATLITGIPQAIVSIMVASMSDRFRYTIATNLSAIFVTLVIFSSVINLTIYLCMSRRIREVTMSYLCCVCRKVNGKKRTSGATSLQISQKTHSKITGSAVVC